MILAVVPWLLPVVVAVIGWLIAKSAIRILAVLFRGFNRGFNAATGLYTRAIGGLLRFSAVAIVVYCGLLAATWWGFATTPKGFVPSQDMGYMIVNVQLPDAASIERTREITLRTQKIAHDIPGIAHTLSVSGMSFLNNATSSIFGSMFVILDEPRKARSPELSLDNIAKQFRTACEKPIPEAEIQVLPPAPNSRRGAHWAALLFAWSCGTATTCRRCKSCEAAINELIDKGKAMKTPAGKPLFAAASTVFRAQRSAVVRRSQPAAVHDAARCRFPPPPTCCGSTSVRSTSTTSAFWTALGR